jgi:hypothetical protein
MNSFFANPFYSGKAVEGDTQKREKREWVKERERVSERERESEWVSEREMEGSGQEHPTSQPTKHIRLVYLQVRSEVVSIVGEYIHKEGEAGIHPDRHTQRETMKKRRWREHEGEPRDRRNGALQ